MKFKISVLLLTIIGIFSINLASAKSASVCIGSGVILQTSMDRYINYDNINLKDIKKVEGYLKKLKTTAKKERNTCQVKEIEDASSSLQSQKESFA